MPHAGVPTARDAAPRPALVVTVLSSVGLVASLCMTLVVPVVPQLPQLLDTSTATASWVITATLLAGAVATPIAGRLGDMVGKRRVLLATLALLVVGSVLCAVTSALLPVLLGRALQGVAVSAVPLGISLMRDTLPPARLGSGIALMSATLGIGGGLGLPLSALIVQVADWHALFWVAGGLGLAGLLLVAVVIPETATRSGGHFDAVGAVGLSVGLIGLLLAVSKGGEWGWTSTATLTSAGVAVVALLAWGAYEMRVTDPLVDLRLNARRAVLLPNLISIPVGVAMFTGMVVFPQLLSAPLASGHGLGLSLLAAGLTLAPNGLVMMLMSPVTARISARMGPRTSLRIGLVVIAVAYAASTVLLSAAWQISVVISVIGAGVALSYGALPALIMRAVPTTRTAAANGLNTLMRSIGTSTASALAAVVLAGSTMPVEGTLVPSLGALRTTLLIAAGCAVLALLVSLAVPSLPEPEVAAERAQEEAPVPAGAGTDGHEADRHEADRHEADRHEADRHEADRHEADRHEADGHGPAVLRGRVLHDHGAPAAGARVTLVDLDGRQLAVSPVDGDGVFAADPGPHRPVLLIAGLAGARPAAVHVVPGQDTLDRPVVLSPLAR
ncbi:MFS transporter [Actinomycetospora cinnamomea]|uniref:EmrB/QacA subfamily drug resistance transporter n=1 Tax=Actinomycetospora cinnamomea TaxID=663609 RepID=A0A2U1FQE2_9PSEU|nr:MFS transporter [Actinomycetospora cinnamomea]PVZ14366.1 EmrB/QacA subfamily drug resistance transporter [Actinomycetospora cinnamomea]